MLSVSINIRRLRNLEKAAKRQEEATKRQEGKHILHCFIFIGGKVTRSFLDEIRNLMFHVYLDFSVLEPNQL